MKELTDEQFIELYGEAKVKFHSYHEYTFTFTGEFQGKDITVHVGGDSGDIYRFEVASDREYKVLDLPITHAEVSENKTTIHTFSIWWL